jgi:hypothetical protein
VRPSRPVSRVLLSLLLIFCACARQQPSAQPPAPAATPALGDLQEREIKLLKLRLAKMEGELAEQRTARLVFETQVQMAGLRGLAIREPLQYQPLTGQTLDRIYHTSIARQYPDRSLALHVWFNALLGALPWDYDMVGNIRKLMGEQAGGLYDPDGKIFYVRPDFDIEGPLGRMILAHEITHALQDQNFDLLGLGIEDATDSDRALAVLAVAEGDATLAMSEHLARYGSPMSLMADLPGMMMMDQQQLNQAPLFVQQSLLFPYMQGMNFFTGLGGRTRQAPEGRWRPGESPAWRSQLFLDPPATTEQIMHPEKYLARELPAAIAPTDAPTSGVAHVEDIAGEFGIAGMLMEALGGDRAYAAAAGWNGDRLRVTEDTAGSGQRTALWISRWDTPRDADEFAQAVADALAKRFPDLKWQGTAAARRATVAGGTLALRRSGRDGVELRVKLPLTHQ